MDPTPPHDASPTAALRVLLVDDNAVNLEVSEDLLRSFGLIVETARQGARAVEMAQRRHYDLILMDLRMPVMDGLEATRRIRAERGLQPPILALTANATLQDREASRLAGMDEHIAKPVDAALLHAVLQRWLPGGLPPLAALPTGAADSGPDDEAALTQRLDAIEGFDLAGSLRNLNGQLSRLQRVLRRFADTYGHGEPGLLQAAQAMDAELGWQLCHSLRGACATLCADRLVSHIRAFEAALLDGHDGTALQAQARELDAELLTLARSLDSALRG